MRKFEEKHKISIGYTVIRYMYIFFWSFFLRIKKKGMWEASIFDTLRKCVGVEFPRNIKLYKVFIALFEVTIVAIVVNIDFVKYLPFPEVVTTFISPKEVLESRPLDRPFECLIKTVVYEYVLTL